jgi:hydroxypyruvate isomerase
MTRRQLLHTGAALAAALPLAAQGDAPPKTARKLRLKQGVCTSVFARSGLTFDEQCRQAAALGVQVVDLQEPERWPIIEKYGMKPNMIPGGGHLADGINDEANHAWSEDQFRTKLPLCAKHGVTTMIALSGNRRGKTDEQGWDTSLKLLRKVVPIAESEGVTICLELLNSKVDHKDYQCDHTTWGVELVKRVNSPRFKLLYDIYHMQIMEGDVIRTIRSNIGSIAHFHTAGVPGRHQMDDTQELNYRAIAQALVDLGYSGFMSHEYSPAQGLDPLATLDQMLTLCDV